MAVDDEFWNREELYIEVWATPMKILALKYGVSDVGLAKVCRKLAIPLPGRGYWVREQAGHEITHVPLSQVKEKFSVRKPTPRPAPVKLSDIATQWGIRDKVNSFCPGPQPQIEIFCHVTDWYR